ncbi:MAG: haloacid dehalogenase-like hydrolase [Burkholderiaceae bacterium]|nr:haloacid dehalogenase-like hydrolase [Burkholderiaceae bacterium]MCD8516672.1 haloacid dehalogenase-like hydrolase [Burkholderiaceae bacterium]MCD8536273.1 haloacid dehalogenase-like hydrolase [Burkholderiaceae bacterium]MCD8564746.1 haloacid dehalogenase-like hydrolase [Burkholderiaceae bacterium]
MKQILSGLLLILASLWPAMHQAHAADALPSWNDTATKEAIVGFVEKVTTPNTTTFIAPKDRIAVFDNDGTLWSEQPVYVQIAFLIDRIKLLAPQHPQWQTTQPFKAVLEGDMDTLVHSGAEGLLRLVAATHAGMTSDEYHQLVRDWLRNARHPKTNRPYTEMVYQPMLELLAYLRANGFKTYIVSGGGLEFMRAWVEDIYGIPPQQVVGSSLKSKFEFRDGVPVVVRVPEVEFVSDKEGKPVAIDQHIGRRPVMAVGNSDGDLQMLQWTSAGDGPRFGLIVHHTDGEREVAYDRESKIGKLDRALDQAAQMGWTVVDMKNDWETVFPDN